MPGRVNRRGGRASKDELPRHLRPLFWDYTFKSLSWQADRDLIVGRILSAGTWDALTWLRRKMGDSDLRAWLIGREGAGLSPKQLRFWELILELPPRLVNKWLAGVERTPWDSRRNP